MSTLTIVLGDNSHTAVLNCLNLDSSPATGVSITYASGNDGICTVNSTTGALSPVAEGAVNITGTGQRGSFIHSASGTVFVVANADSGDFTATLDLS